MKRSVKEYESLAKAAEAYIRKEVGLGREYLTYWEVGQHLGVDRFTLAWVLGHLVRLNKKEGGPLWSAFVGYKHDMFDKRRRRLVAKAGEPGNSFIECAVMHGYHITFAKRGDFVALMRAACRNQLALESLAAMQSALRGAMR